MVPAVSPVITRPRDNEKSVAEPILAQAPSVSAADTVVAPLTEYVTNCVAADELDPIRNMSRRTVVPVTSVTLIAVPSPVSVVTNDVDVVDAVLLDPDPTGVTHTHATPL